jgi:hypothetical protein
VNAATKKHLIIKLLGVFLLDFCKIGENTNERRKNN